MRKKEKLRKRRRLLQAIRLWRRSRTRPSKRTPPETIRETQHGELLRNYRHLEVWPVKGLVRDTDGYIKVPKCFSFIDNPDETLEVLERLRTTLANPTLEQIFFDHADCEQLDLCASVVMDVMALRAKKRRFARNGKFHLSGRYSNTPEVNVLLRAIGILSSLEHPHSLLPESLSKRFELFKLRVGHRTTPAKTTMAERYAGELAAFFDKCLQKHGYRLLEDRERNLKHLIGEVLDNAEQHARVDPYWHLIGFYRQSEVGSPKGDCHIGIFNFGDTISESLLRKDANQELKSRVAQFVKHHKKAGHFGRQPGTGRNWMEDDLLTQLALQEGVSRKWNPDDGSDRGNGTVKMIDFFGSLTGAERSMTLVSGHTKINFSPNHRMESQIINGEERKVIAFNASNSLFEMPEESAIEHLVQRFPGMLVSLRFDINEGDLRTKSEVLCEFNPNDH